MRSEGFIDEVSIVRFQTFIAENAPAGSATIVVEEVSELDEDGGAIRLNDVTVTYDSLDVETGTVYLTNALPTAVEIDDPVVPLPEAFEMHASVLTSDEDEAIRAVVHHSLFNRLPEGFREDEREAVSIELRGDTWYVVDVMGQAPTLIDPSELDRGFTQGVLDAAALADRALREAESAMDFAEAKTKVYRQDNAPTGGTYSDGDVWIDTNDENKMYVWNGSLWQTVGANVSQEFEQALQEAQNNASAALGEAQDAFNAANDAQASADAAALVAEAARQAADGTIRTHYGPTPPWADGSTQPEGSLGDLWLNSVTNVASRWNGSTWAIVQDDALADALIMAQNAQATADGKNTTFYNNNAPVATAIGDLWFKTNDRNKPFRWDGTNWAGIQDNSINISGGSGTKTFHNVLSFEKKLNNAPGHIVINTPITFTAKMVRLTMEGYNYLTGQTDIAVVVGFYAYNPTGFYLNTGQTSTGSKRVSARLFTRDSDGTVAIVLDSVVGNWYYPSLKITKAEFSYTEAPDTWMTGWSADLVTDLTGYTLRNTPPVQDLADTNALTQSWRETGKTTIDGGKIEADSVTAAQIKAGTITSASGVIGALDAGAITTGQLSAARINTSGLVIGVNQVTDLTSTLNSKESIEGAQAKADAAAEAAEAAAKTYAEAVASDAGADAISAAAADASTKAEAARLAAISASATDAQNKANTAKTAAEAAAKAHADLVAAGAQQAAIDAAAAYAVSKANEAKNAATAAAAIDATNKANSARDAAITVASGDATSKVSALETIAKSYADNVSSSRAAAARAEAIAAAAADAQTKANAAKTAAESASKAYSDSIQSGGINMLNDSKAVKGAARFIEVPVYDAMKDYVGQNVVYSFEIRSNTAYDEPVSIYPYQNTGISIADTRTVTATSTWTRYELATKVKQHGAVPPPADRTWGGIGHNGTRGADARISVRNVKLELGSVASPWSPSATDAEAFSQASATAAENAAKAHADAVAASSLAAAVAQAASDASAQYSRAKELTTSWGYPTGTEMNGAFIRTGTLAANKIVVGGGDTTPLNTALEAASNKVNNPARTANTSRWSGATLDIVDETINGKPVKAMRAKSSGSTQYYSDYFEVDASKMYEIKFWVKDTALVTGTQFYIGTNTQTTAGNTINILPVNPANGVVGVESTNFYFLSTATPPVNQWVEYIMYVFPTGATPAKMKGYGNNVLSNAQFLPGTAKMRLRFLNWENKGTERHLLVTNISVTEASMDAAAAAETRAVASAAEAAETAFGASRDRVTSWTTPGFTTINGGRLETNSVKADSIDALAITAKHTITGALVQSSGTANRGIKFNSAALMAYDSVGTPTFSLTSATGAVSMKGDLKSGSTISGATLLGPLQTTATANRGIKITNGGMYAYSDTGVMTFGANALTGNVVMKGSLTSGSSIDGSVMTGGTVQTDGAANRGIKMNNAGIAAYDSKAGSSTLGQAMFTVSPSTGDVAMRGTLVAGSSINGADITGSSFTTGISSAQPRVLITSGSINGTQMGFVRFSPDLTWTNRGWGGGQLFSQYWAEGGANWGAVRLHSPTHSRTQLTTAYIDVREREWITGRPALTQATLKADEVNLIANSMMLNTPNGSVFDFTLAAVPNGKSTFSFRRTESQTAQLDIELFEAVPGANPYGATENVIKSFIKPYTTGAYPWTSGRLRLDMTTLTFNSTSTGGPNVYYGIGLSGNTPFLGNANTGIRFGQQGTLFVENSLGGLANIRAFNVAVSSDPALKEDVVACGTGGALEAVCNTTVYDYSPVGTAELLEDGVVSPERASQRFRGIMSDEAKETMPEVVIEDEGEPESIDLYAYISTLHLAIQEMAAEIGVLKNN